MTGTVGQALAAGKEVGDENEIRNDMHMR